MDAAILMPDLVKTPGNMFIQKPLLPDGSSTFLARALLTNTSGTLVAIASAGVLCYGMAPDPSHAATDTPPTAMFADNHYPWDVTGGEIEINVGTLSGTTTGSLNAGAAGSAITPAAFTIGGEYGIVTATTGTYAGYQFISNAAVAAAAALFVVVGKVDGVADTDYNGRIRVKVKTNMIQG
jgi:hypothetical protein